MVWVFIALAVLFSVLLLLHLIRFHFSIQARTPASLQGSLGVSFLWLRRELSADAGRAFSSKHDAEAEPGEKGTDAPVDAAGAGAAAQEFPGQRGALGVPEAWRRAIARWRARFRLAATKWALDWQVWRILLRFTLKSSRRVLKLLRPALKSIHLGMEDAYDLGRIAALWSVLRGTIPAFSAPAEFGFGEKFRFEASVGGGFTGLGALAFILLTLFSFPWIALARRFALCWRDPRLNRWQRRVLLP